MAEAWEPLQFLEFSRDSLMTLELQIPDNLVLRVAGDGNANSASRAILEGYAVQAYVENRLTRREIRELLGLQSDGDAIKLLAAHGQWGPTSAAEVDLELANFRRFQAASKAAVHQ